MVPNGIFQFMNLANVELFRRCFWVQEALHPVATHIYMPGEGADISDGCTYTWL